MASSGSSPGPSSLPAGISRRKARMPGRHCRTKMTTGPAGPGGKEEGVPGAARPHEPPEPVVGRAARTAQPVLLQAAAVAGVELVAVAVALVDDLGVVGLPYDRVGPQHRRVGAEPHRAAL